MPTRSRPPPESSVKSVIYDFGFGHGQQLLSARLLLGNDVFVGECEAVPRQNELLKWVAIGFGGGGSYFEVIETDCSIQ